MIGSLSKAIKSIFGDKAQRDLKEIQPLVDRIKEEFTKLSGLSNDDLRARTASLKARVADHTKVSDDKVAALRKDGHHVVLVTSGAIARGMTMWSGTVR